MWKNYSRQRHDSEPDEPDAKFVLGALEHRGGAWEMMFSVETWKDPSTWGIFLADLARHVGNAYEQAYGMPAAQTTSRVLEKFHAEIDHPADQTRGHLHTNRHSVSEN